MSVILVPEGLGFCCLCEKKLSTEHWVCDEFYKKNVETCKFILFSKTVYKCIIWIEY